MHLSLWIIRKIRRILPALPSSSKKIPFQSYRVDVYKTACIKRVIRRVFSLTIAFADKNFERLINQTSESLRFVFEHLSFIHSSYDTRVERSAIFSKSDEFHHVRIFHAQFPGLTDPIDPKNPRIYRETMNLLLTRLKKSEKSLEYSSITSHFSISRSSMIEEGETRGERDQSRLRCNDILKIASVLACYHCYRSIKGNGEEKKFIRYLIDAVT